MKSQIPLFILSLAIVIMVAGCQSIREMHYFKDKAGNPPNYYRLQIKGHAFLTSSRYLSGNFDEEAVNYYFGEIEQPQSVKFESKQLDSKQPNQGIEPIGSDGKKFVLMLSTNSDAISTAFGNFVESKETQLYLARIINRDKLIELEEMKVSENAEMKRRNRMIILGENYLNSITVSESPESIRIKLLAYLNATAEYFGNPQNFTDLGVAQKWFMDNRNSLINR
ncbi:MAG: hypothetical protein KF725_15315 [Cyclobacteriaceae bacterium]|nr:hypothetical protein [Cyclobacteriaceae bacterium]UYN87713.1 MAG: hypothetical protein KIT51_05495 [Cyclobacteriaceae bacterium]